MAFFPIFCSGGLIWGVGGLAPALTSSHFSSKIIGMRYRQSNKAMPAKLLTKCIVIDL